MMSWCKWSSYETSYAKQITNSYKYSKDPLLSECCVTHGTIYMYNESPINRGLLQITKYLHNYKYLVLSSRSRKRQSHMVQFREAADRCFIQEFVFK